VARIRSVKPEFWQDEKLSTVSRDARLLFIGLWNFADEQGRLRGNPKKIRGEVFPYDDDLDVSALLDELSRIGCVVRYYVDGQSYLWIRHFERHQKTDPRLTSKLPAPSPADAQVCETPNTPICSDIAPTHRDEKAPSRWQVAGGREQVAGSKWQVASSVEQVPAAQAEPATRPPLELTSPPEKSPPTPVVEVFEHWRDRMRKDARTLCSPKRRKRIEERLEEGWSVEELKLAIDGCAVTPHNQGQNERGEKYDDLELICRDAEHVERFMRNARAPPRPMTRGRATEGEKCGPDYAMEAF
jgi:hypothetical protein